MTENAAAPRLTRNEIASVVLLVTTVLLMACNPVSGPWLLDQLAIVGAALVEFLGGVATMIWSTLSAVAGAIADLIN